MQNFTYTPLTDNDKTRVLRLHEGHGNAELVGELITLKQGEEIEYEALSYWWGHKEAGRHLVLKKDNRRYSIPIRPELENALMQLRLRDQPRNLWVDAICIRQDDSAEKNSQIPKMAEIYSEATNVCVWLGTEENNSDKALKFIDRVLNLDEIDQLVINEKLVEEWNAFSKLIRRPWFNRRWIVQEVAMAKRATMHCGEGTVSWTNFKDAVALFSSRPEPLRQLFQSSRTFSHHPDHLGEIKELGANRLVVATSSMFRKSDDGDILEHLFSLETIMSSLSAFEASDPRDILYAVVRLANDAHPSAMQRRVASLVEDENIMTPAATPAKSFYEGVLGSNLRNVTMGQPSSNGGSSASPNTLQVPKAAIVRRAAAAFLKPLQDKLITVDYNKSVFEVCKDFVAFSIGRSRSLDIICRPWAPYSPSEDYDLPSWVCTRAGLAFERGDDHKYYRVAADPLVGTPSLGRKIYNASGKTKAVWKFGDELAKDVDTSKIQELHKSLLVEGFVLSKVKCVQEMAVGGNIPVQWLKAVKWEKAMEPPSRFWRTLVADRGPEGQAWVPPYWERACKHAFSKVPVRAHLNVVQMIDHRTNSFTKEFLQRALAVVFNRKLFEDEQGNVGLAPDEVQPGDLICILDGCSVPVLLRITPRTQTGASAERARNADCPVTSAEGTSPGPKVQTRMERLVPNSNSDHGLTDRRDFAAEKSNEMNRLRTDHPGTAGNHASVGNTNLGVAGNPHKRKRSQTDTGLEMTGSKRITNSSSK
jgi:Heterokaryon incompatibility protein (HET)